MFLLERGRSRVVPALALLMCCSIFAFRCTGQPTPPTATLTGVVVDPVGARISGAIIHIQASDLAASTLIADAAGRFSTHLSAGTYTLLVEAPAFEQTTRPNVSLVAGGTTELTIQLTIAVASEVVDVSPDERSGLSAADNQSAIIFNERELAALSDDNATMQQQLLAMAGGDPMHPAEVYINGFSGGKFPPKSSIRQVRINQNPYSAQYPRYGQNRMEVFTKPGGATFHGGLEANGNDSSFNANNPYTGAEPPYYTYYLDGHLSGPLGKKTSFFADSTTWNQQSNAVINAIDPVTLGPISQAVPTPNVIHTDLGRMDREMSPSNTLTARYEFNRSTATNSGIGLFTLATEGVNIGTTTQTLQLSDSEIFSPKVVAESRFQYIRTRIQQTAQNDTATIIVQGEFNGGGSSAGNFRDNQDRYEFQQFVSLDRGKHFVRLGGRYILLRDSNTSTANYNGTYIFPTLASYQARTPSQFSLTAGQPNAALVTGDLGIYADDEWKLRKSLTLDAGLRFETQSAIPDHADWAPRLGFAYAVGQRDKKAPMLVLRGGFGIFFQRFDAANLLTAVRQNGISQQTVTVTNPGFFMPATSPTVASLETGANETAPTPYNVSPRLHAAYEMRMGLTAEHTFGRFGTVSVTYLRDRDVHQYMSRNFNAPLPGTAALPLGHTGAVYQFASDGIGKSDTIWVNGNFHLTKRLTAWGFYFNGTEKADSTGASSFGSNQYNLAVDFGHVPYPTQRVFTGANLSLPWSSSLGFFLGATSKQPFDITTGTDLNGDTIYNDRPAFATDLTRPSVVRTAYGNFDTAPIAGQTIIPVNFGRSPGSVSWQLTASKSVAFGPRPARPASATTGNKAASAAAKPPAKADAPYSLSFSVEVQNPFNHVNPGAPVGVLNSPLFGRSLSLNNFFTLNTAANRAVLLSTSFNF